MIRKSGLAVSKNSLLHKLFVAAIGYGRGHVSLLMFMLDCRNVPNTCFISAALAVRSASERQVVLESGVNLCKPSYLFITVACLWGTRSWRNLCIYHRGAGGFGGGIKT